jgi:dTDP-4-amino-4,6-dideoxygalactose transaminase
MRDAVTVITRSHLPLARVLDASLRAHDDSVRLTVVLTDAKAADSGGEAFEILDPTEVGIDEREWHRRAAMYDPQGLISSLRPHAIAHLLDGGAPSVLLLDADMVAFGPLGDLWDRAAESGVLLSPHAVQPARGRSGHWTGEQAFLLNGTFNGGLIGVSGAATAFLDWIAARTRRDCLFDRSRALLYSQTWLNLVPALFDHSVIRDPGVNTTIYMLDGTDLEGEPDRPLIAGLPVRLFHFASLLDGAAADDGDYFAIDRRPVLRQVVAEYRDSLRAAGWQTHAGYGWDTLPSGEPVTESMRGRYREAVLTAEDGRDPEPPDPFDAGDPDAFVAWWDGLRAGDAAGADAEVVFGRPFVGDDDVEAVAATLRSGWLGPGPRVREFERALEARLGGGVHVSCVASATAALYLVLHLHGIGPGDEVLLPALTFVGCAQAVEMTGALAVPVDCEPRTHLLSLEHAESLITPRTRALMLMHIAGRPADVGAAARLGDDHGILVLEDAAHGLGAAWPNGNVGTSGNPTVFSFQATKNITSIEGGAVATPDADLAERVARAASHGLDRSSWARFSEGDGLGYRVIGSGFKFGMTDVEAALGAAQLSHLDEWISVRSRQWSRYGEALAGLPLEVPAEPEPGTVHARHLYQVGVPPGAPLGRDELAEELRAAGIGTGLHYPALPLHPYLRDRHGMDPATCPEAIDASRRLLSLPLGPALSPGDQARVGEVLRALLVERA